MDDVPFIDSLQKKFGKQLGFMKTSWLLPRIEKREVLVAEDVKREDVKSDESRFTSSRFTPLCGYIIFQDKYLGREELGLIVQLCVDPSKQRGLVGVGDWFEPGVTLSVLPGNGIVDPSSGDEWAGGTDLGIPFP